MRISSFVVHTAARSLLPMRKISNDKMCTFDCGDDFIVDLIYVRYFLHVDRIISSSLNSRLYSLPVDDIHRGIKPHGDKSLRRNYMFRYNLS